ncbi:hypothetical protein HPC49_25070 [Pyxidicoccus fallax]|uniref:Uncharacterized protein n=1 Tax=Pyxidicoccus fallax TaxID=394095 RepID=A0A848LF64_9BACT|nr:hypothetical protein [Pyxidicoccus fallax]NMO14168.1 hypothetical protein [Pyxidicoccus fallax]NPC81487.1 hypothetical protein [Pyxidicoccus fallax]
MSDDSKSNFGKPHEPKKNPKVFGVPVKIDPYTSVRPDHPTGEWGMPDKKKKRDDAPFDPFAVVIESPQGD